MSEHTLRDLESALEAVEGELPASVNEAALERMRIAARVLDEGIRLPGTKFRFGIDPIVSVLPGAGDLVMAVISMYLVLEASRLDVSRRTLVRMLVNIAVDAAGGSVPVLGTVFDATWKANKRNFELALRDLATAGRTAEADEPVALDAE